MSLGAYFLFLAFNFIVLPRGLFCFVLKNCGASLTPGTLASNGIYLLTALQASDSQDCFPRYRQGVLVPMQSRNTAHECVYLLGPKAAFGIPILRWQHR